MRLTRLIPFLCVTLSVFSPPASLAQQCGGDERWPVKVGSDTGASLVNLVGPVPISIHDLVRVARPQLPSDDTTRLAAERIVYVVDGRLLKFKVESGRTGDQDYHLVVTDDTLQFSAAGTGTTPVEHSVIAEIVNPDCVPGRHGTTGTTSLFQARLADIRTRFNQRFPNITGGWNEADGVPVRITAVGFFDRPHGQTGRALNGIELHPVLDIVFNPTGGTPPPPPTATMLLQNPGFEGGDTGWVAGTGVINKDPNEPARSGSFKAWLGGFGTAHTDRVFQEVTLPAVAHALTLAFFVHISTEEQQPQVFDKLTVALRRPNGTLIKNLVTLSNQNAAPGFQLKSFDLTPFKGQTLRIYFTGTEDNGSLTSFIIDDVQIVVE